MQTPEYQEKHLTDLREAEQFHRCLASVLAVLLRTQIHDSPPLRCSETWATVCGVFGALALLIGVLYADALCA